MKKGWLWTAIFYFLFFLFIVQIFFFFAHGGIGPVKVTIWFSILFLTLWAVFLFLFYQYVFYSLFTENFMTLVLVIFTLVALGTGIPYGGITLVF